MPADEEDDRGTFAPPLVPVQVCCLHCGQEYDSSLMEKKRIPELGEGWHWVCPTPGCGAAGFGFDILPTDPEYRDEHGGGWVEEEDYDGTVDGAVWDQFCADSFKATLRAADSPDDLEFTYDIDPEPPLSRMLSPEEWKKRHDHLMLDDIPF